MENSLRLISPAFENNGKLPSRYTCSDESKGKISPPLQTRGVDPSAKSLTLIMDDPDAVSGVWDHWLVFNISPNVSTIAEGLEPGGTPGSNSWGSGGYGGPCPPSGEHRYVFKLYSLDTMLALPAGATKAEVETAMQGHILQQAELVGLYQRQ